MTGGNHKVTYVLHNNENWSFISLDVIHIFF